MYFAVWATDRPGALEARERARPAHRARLRDPAPHAVEVVAGGPTLDEATGSMNGTLLVVRADSIEAVRRYLDGDPYRLQQVYASVEVRAWTWSLGAPAIPGEAPGSAG
ncbi:MAG TPA: YciI family protein [Burkholderiaceae bacterium]|nr:YciI family protein [Burkholderiaceae bacterium]